ncbi:NAD(P)H-quinone oxidoreductase [Rhizosphaericola mali]|uniref:NAD(P)H-quinone oxidoreductase n=1 Tax=Rhizosphaericola mali TaxID=2545455 RepID=A0A5P2G0S8_9BACT|nr:NAD(P)H-quinone oxidoreductase [Rhizosphaericola mali]QES87442.1 NAD(P)H-quinone oxidoreductase [Rhizosphaericola mali]
MKAIVIESFGGPEVLKLQIRPDPTIASDEILIDVKASGINRPDIFQRKGNYPAPAGVAEDIPGLEVAGEIIEIGDDVSLFKKGDKVCALVAGGGYADRVAVKEGQCLPIPENIDYVEAASLPETVFTVWSNVFQRGQLKSGENILVHGGSSGIGITTIQLAKALGSKVFTTVGSDEKATACKEIGAEIVVNYKTQDFKEVLKTEKIDVVLDMIGGEYFNKNIDLLAEEGRLVYINAMQGNKVELNIGKMMIKRLHITGSTLRSRDYDFKKALAKDIELHVWPLLIAGKFKPIVYKKFAPSDIEEAHKLMESSNHIGKIVIDWTM